MIQTIILINQLKGLNFDIDPKDIINPSGNANISVNPNNRTDVPKPSSNSKKIWPTDII